MIFNNIGNKSEIPHFCLCLKTAALVIVRCNFLTVIPALFRSAENRFIEIKHGREISIIPNEIRKLLVLCVENFAYGKSIVWLKGAVPHFSKEFPDSSRFFQHFSNIAKSVLAVWLVIMHGKSFLNINDRINSETAQALVQPPVDVLVNLFTKFRIFPVQVWLFLVENMKILLVGSRKILPHRAAEIRAPVGWKLVFFFVP